MCESYRAPKKDSARAFAAGESRNTHVNNCRKGVHARWEKDIKEAMCTQELVHFIPTEWMRRNGSYTQYCNFFQKKTLKKKKMPFLDEASLERNVGGCKLNTWCDGQAAV
jgi:hypothetical protein